MAGGEPGLGEEEALLFNPKRFAIATLLYVSPTPLPLAGLRERLGLTWGDLDSNIRRLASAGLVEVVRLVTPSGVRAHARLTEKGRRAYERLASYLNRVTGEALARGRGAEKTPRHARGSAGGREELGP